MNLSKCTKESKQLKNKYLELSDLQFTLCSHSFFQERDHNHDRHEGDMKQFVLFLRMFL